MIYNVRIVSFTFFILIQAFCEIQRFSARSETALISRCEERTNCLVNHVTIVSATLVSDQGFTEVFRLVQRSGVRRRNLTLPVDTLNIIILFACIRFVLFVFRTIVKSAQWRDRSILRAMEI